MVKRGELESLDKDEIIDLFVAFAEKIEKNWQGVSIRGATSLPVQ